MSDKKAVDKQLESILGEEAAEVLSSDKRAVIDEALSIANNVLGHEAPAAGMQTEESSVEEAEVQKAQPSEPVEAETVSPVVQPVVTPVAMVGQPIIKTPEMAKTETPKRNKPIRLIVTNDINEQTPIKPKTASVKQPVKVGAGMAPVAAGVPEQPVKIAMEEIIPENAVIAEPVEAPVEAAATVEPEMAPVEEAATVEPETAPVEEAATVGPETASVEKADAPLTGDDMKMGELFGGTDIDAAYGEIPVKDVIEGKPKKKKVRTGVKILLGTLIVLCILAVGGAIFINSFLDRINYVQPTISAQGSKEDDEPANNLDAALVLKNEGVHGDNSDETVVVDYDGDENLSFLLIGEEAIGESEGSGVNGRSDSMMVLTVNTEKKTVKLISFMRDLYMEIPGYGHNRLNAAYQLGGSELVSKTLNANFGIYVDGYVKVNFDGFSDIIDAVGGVDVTLTEEEALYLNTTNYISKKKYRTVVAGKQTLNGNQALGYCRVRKRACITGETDDYGRTARQRLVIEDIFKKVKKMRLFDMLGLAYDALPMISTDIPKKEIISYVKLAASLDLKQLETSRIPANGTFTGQEVRLGNVGAKVLVPDLEANKQILVDFLYGGEVPPDVQARMEEAAMATPEPTALPAY